MASWPATRAGPGWRRSATGLEAPWEIAFLPDGRALVTERPGRVRLLERDLTLREEPIAEVEVAAIGEGGLLGAAVDPRFRRNGFVYLYRTTNEGNEVVRYRFEGDGLADETVIAEGIAASAIHDGGRIHFGPDGRLYFSTGDAAQDDLAQDPQSLNGKILRLAPGQFRGAGGRPEVFSLGHRNPQGFDWQPRRPPGRGRARAGRRRRGERPARGRELRMAARARRGPRRLRGPGGGLPGVDRTLGRHVRQPARLGVDGRLPARRAGRASRSAACASTTSGRVTLDEALFEGEFGRVRTVVEGPDGALYALTSNRDGRGSPSARGRPRDPDRPPPASGGVIGTALVVADPPLAGSTHRMYSSPGPPGSTTVSR